MKHPDSHKDVTVPASSAVAEVSLKSAYDGSEYADMERSLLGLPGVAAAHLDRTRGVAHITYDPSVTTAERLEAQFQRCGYACNGWARRGRRSGGRAQVPKIHRHGTQLRKRRLIRG